MRAADPSERGARERVLRIAGRIVVALALTGAAAYLAAAIAMGETKNLLGTAVLVVLSVGAWRTVYDALRSGTSIPSSRRR